MATQEAADRCAHLIQLWLDNEQGSHEYVREIAAGYGDAYSVGRAIKDYVEELCGLDDMPAGIASDLLGFCLAVVDWQAMGERYIEMAREMSDYEEPDRCPACGGHEGIEGGGGGADPCECEEA